jgi:hypothetical protein
MLPDSTINADSSKGFVQYRIKAKPGRTVGTIIRNTGYIYFDYNSAIVTNTTFNLYRSLASVDETNKETGVSIYPNPSTGIFTIKLEDEKNSTIEVYNIIGEKIFSLKTQNESTLIDLTDQPRGMYILKIIGSKQSFNERIIKQ